MNKRARKFRVEQLIDVLSVTAADLQSLLTEGAMTSLELVQLYRDQIQRHNHDGLKVNSVLSLVPDDIVNDRAKLLDEERAKGHIRSVLHGIPITVKVGLWASMNRREE
jgi:amidase